MLWWLIGFIIIIGVGIGILLTFSSSKKEEKETFESHVHPHGKIQKLVDGVWQVTGKIPRGSLPRNMLIYKLPNSDSLLLHSVVALNQKEMEVLDSLGSPSIIIVPNAMHTLDTVVYQRRYPFAKIVSRLESST